VNTIDFLSQSALESREMEESSELIKQRVRKLEELKDQGINPYPNDFRVTHTTKDILEAYNSLSDEELKAVENLFPCR
jgi:lysyl-tRNA synthetase class 2